jgi:hypothetical protein
LEVETLFELSCKQLCRPCALLRCSGALLGCIGSLLGCVRSLVSSLGGGCCGRYLLVANLQSLCQHRLRNIDFDHG